MVGVNLQSSFGVLKEVQGDKAPGHVFTMAFFQKCLRVVEGYVMVFLFVRVCVCVCAGFHRQCVFEKSLNVSFVLSLLLFLRRITPVHP